MDNCVKKYLDMLSALPQKWAEIIACSLCENKEEVDCNDIKDCETLTSLSSFSIVNNKVSITFKDEKGVSVTRSFDISVIPDIIDETDGICLTPVTEQLSWWSNLSSSEKWQAIVDRFCECCSICECSTYRIVNTSGYVRNITYTDCAGIPQDLDISDETTVEICACPPFDVPDRSGLTITQISDDCSTTTTTTTSTSTTTTTTSEPLYKYYIGTLFTCSDGSCVEQSADTEVLYFPVAASVNIGDFYMTTMGSDIYRIDSLTGEDLSAIFVDTAGSASCDDFCSTTTTTTTTVAPTTTTTTSTTTTTTACPCKNFHITNNTGHNISFSFFPCSSEPEVFVLLGDTLSYIACVCSEDDINITPEAGLTITNTEILC